MVTTPKPKKNTRAQLIKELKLILGGGMVRLELTPDHYDLAIDLALDRYRQRSPNSTEERFAFIEMQPNITEYYLPEEVVAVKSIYRRNTTGTSSGTGVNFDPFGQAFVNQFVLGGGNQASLVTYELFSDFQKTVGKMFGLYINYTFHPTEHRLDVMRDFHANESMLLWISNARPEETLFADLSARPWLRDYAVARCKVFIGEARSKFNTIAGPQSGTTLNGEALKTEGTAEMVRLEDELKMMVDQDTGFWFVFG